MEERQPGRDILPPRESEIITDHRSKADEMEVIELRIRKARRSAESGSLSGMARGNARSAWPHEGTRSWL